MTCPGLAVPSCKAVALRLAASAATIAVFFFSVAARSAKALRLAASLTASSSAAANLAAATSPGLVASPISRVANAFCTEMISSCAATSKANRFSIAATWIASLLWASARTSAISLVLAPRMIACDSASAAARIAFFFCFDAAAMASDLAAVAASIATERSPEMRAISAAASAPPTPATALAPVAGAEAATAPPTAPADTLLCAET